MKMPSRRAFLKGALFATGGGVVAYSAWDYFGDSTARGKIVIVGGGAAGISVAARLTDLLRHPDITLIDPNTTHHYQPGYTLVASGDFTPEEILMPQRELIPSGTRWIKDSVVELRPEKNEVRTAANGLVAYDFLVLVPGGQMDFDSIEGLSRKSLGEGNAHCIYDFDGAQRCHKALESMVVHGEGRMVFSDTYTKLKCGGAPKKICFIAEDLVRDRGIRDRFTFDYYGNSTNLMTPKVFGDRLAKLYGERSVHTHFLHRLKAVDTRNKVATFEQLPKSSGAPTPADANHPTVRVEYDFLHFVPPMSAPDFVKNSGLGFATGGLREGGWIEVDPYTLVHPRFSNILTFGDAAGLPTSKTGAAVRMQAPVAARNVVALMEGREPPARYDGYSACPIVTERGKVLMAEFKYDEILSPSLPWLDPAMERGIWWTLKRHGLKPMYYHGMLKGRL